MVLGWLRRKFRWGGALVLREIAAPERLSFEDWGDDRVPAPARRADVISETLGDLSESEVLANLSHDRRVEPGDVAGTGPAAPEDWIATAERRAQEAREKHAAYEAEQRAHREAFIWKAREHFQLHLAPVSDPIIKGAIERSLMSLARLLLDPAHDEVPR